MRQLWHKVFHEWLGRSQGLVHFVREGLTYRTAGLADIGQAELEITVSKLELVDDAGRLLKFATTYIHNKDARIKPGETFVYGFWMVRFVLTGRGPLAAWDLVPGTSDEFRPNADITLGYYRAQLETCARADTDFRPPRGDELAGYDEGVLQGLPVELYRDPRVSSNQSGWIILSSAYDAGTSAPRVGHLYEITKQRPELVPYLGLPRGWRVDLRGREQMTFEPDLSRS